MGISRCGTKRYEYRDIGKGFYKEVTFIRLTESEVKKELQEKIEFYKNQISKTESSLALLAMSNKKFYWKEIKETREENKKELVELKLLNSKLKTLLSDIRDKADEQYIKYRYKIPEFAEISRMTVREVEAVEKDNK